MGGGREVAAGQTGDVESQARQLHKEGHGAEAKGGRAWVCVWGGSGCEISRREGTGFKFSDGDEDFKRAAARQSPPRFSAYLWLGPNSTLNLCEL